MNTPSSPPSAPHPADNTLPPPSVWSVRTWLAFSLLALAVAGAWAARVVKLELGAQYSIAESANSWGLNACVALGLAGLAGVARPIWIRLGPRRMAQIAVVSALGWLFAGAAPTTHRIFFDEQIYMQIGQTYAHTGKLAAASYARAEHGRFEYYNGEINKQPQGWPYVYGQAARVFGVSPRLGQEINRLAIACSAGLLCLALMLAPWNLPKGTPIAAGLSWALTPMVCWWGRTAAVEPLAATTAIGAFCAAVIYARLRTSAPLPVRGQPAAGALLAAATAFATYFRPESLLVFPLVAAVLWADEDDFVRDLVAWGALALALALIAPGMTQLWAMRDQDWGATDGRRFNMDVFGDNLRSNTGYFYLGREFPLIGTVLAAFGMLWMLFHARAVAVVFASWFLPAWGIFVLFYAGGYHYGASNRFAVISAAPVAIALGLGAAALINLFRSRPAWLGLAASLAALSWSRAFAWVPTLGREAIEVQEEVGFVAEQARLLPSGSLIITQVPAMWLIKGRNATTWPNVSDMANGRLHELANQFPGGVYLHYGFWEHAEADRADVAARTIVDFQAHEVSRFSSHAMNFAMYRLDTPEALSRLGGPLPDHPARREGELENALRRAREKPPVPSPEVSPNP